MKGKMKALVKDRAGPGLAIRFVDIPALGPHDVLVKVLATSICGSDLHIYEWDRWAAERMRPPAVIGHEMAGIIIRVGSAVTNWQKDDYVSIECHQACGHCYQCRAGQSYICQNYSILGIDFDGCFAEYVRVPEGSLWKNDANIPPEFACLQDPVGNAVMAVASHEVIGQNVLITGCGPIGLFAVGIATTLGAAKVYAVDINEYRLGIARQMGADLTINSQQRNLVEEVMLDTGGLGIDLFVEMSGDKASFLEGLQTVKNGGRVALLGIPAEKICFDLANEIILKGITLSGITGREIFATWYKTSALLKNYLDISPVITHKMRLEQFEEAFRLMQSRECGKIILYPY